MTPWPYIALLLLCLTPTLGHADASVYVALDAKGKQAKPQAGARPHACVRDNGTGLVWEVKTDDHGPADKDWIFSWYDKTLEGKGVPVGYPDSGRCGAKGRCDTQAYVAYTNKRGLCGFRDWRLPTVQELEGLLRPEAPGAKIDARFFPNTPAGYFWTGDYVPTEVGGAMLVSFELSMSLLGNSASGGYVRLVRGPGKH